MSVPHLWFGPTTDPLQLCVSSFHVMLFIVKAVPPPRPPYPPITIFENTFSVGSYLTYHFCTCNLTGVLDLGMVLSVYGSNLFKSFWSWLLLKTISRKKMLNVVFHLCEFAAFLRKFNWL
jgi:hypothetical protein